MSKVIVYFSRSCDEFEIEDVCAKFEGSTHFFGDHFASYTADPSSIADFVRACEQIDKTIKIKIID